MKYLKYTHRLLFICFITIGVSNLISCSKDKVKADDDVISKAGITMKVNGENWESSMTTLLSEEQEKDEFGEYHFVSIVGSRVINKNSQTEDDMAESVTMFIAIPASKFRNPKGTYPVVWESAAKLSQSTAIFASASTLLDAETYVPAQKGQSGTVEITGFEIGDQKVMGHPTGTEGYTKLSGTFSMDLRPLNNVDSGKPLKITEGKFNLSGGLGFQH